MSRKRQKSLHGAALDAPSETFVPGQSPTPSPSAADVRGGAGKHRARAESAPGATSAGSVGRPARKAAGKTGSTPGSGGSEGAVGATLGLLKLFAGVVLAVGAALLVAWGILRYATSTPRFSIKTVEVVGNSRLSQREIEQRLGFEPGTNIFKADPSAAERHLLESPWVREVKVTRRLPSTLRIELAEREAAATAVIGGRIYLVTRAGEPFKEVEPTDPWDLPVVTGVSAENLARDRPSEVGRIATALEVLRNWDRVPQSQVHAAEEAHVTDGGDVVLTVGKSAITLYLGQAPFRQKLLMAARVIELVGQKGKVPGIVFADNRAHPERVVVRMR